MKVRRLTDHLAEIRRLAANGRLDGEIATRLGVDGIAVTRIRRIYAIPSGTAALALRHTTESSPLPSPGRADPEREWTRLLAGRRFGSNTAAR